MKSASTPAPECASPVFNILSFNLRYQNPDDGVHAWMHRKEMVAGVFADHRVDIAGLQEALVEQIGDLEGCLPDYGWIGVGRSDGQSGGEFTPIFYRRDRFVVETHGTFWLSDSPDVPGSRGWDALLARTATWGVFRHQASGKRLFFINTHLDHRGTQARQHSASLLAERIAHLHGDLPVLLTGDFNSTPDSAAVKTLTDNVVFNLTDARQATATPHVGGNQSANGFNADGPDLVIDYIFVGPGIEIRSHGYYPKIEEGVFVSDHWPVVSQISLPP